jgi:hypothetical protein
MQITSALPVPLKSEFDCVTVAVQAGSAATAGVAVNSPAINAVTATNEIPIFFICFPL